MRNLIPLVLFLAIGVEIGWAADVGDVMPEFQCLDDQGKIWDSRDHIGQHPLVIYFYPSDFAFCCTRQARCYREDQKELGKQCAEVIGISGDTVEAHQLFKTTNGLDFTLLSDGDGGVATKFGVPLRAGGKAMTIDREGNTVRIPRKFSAARWTFLVGTNGKILYREIQVSPVKDSQVVLEFLRKQNGE